MTDARMRLTQFILNSQPCLFLAKTEEEARLIQVNLLVLGCKWRDSGARVANLERSLQEGIWVEQRIMTVGPSDNKPHAVLSLEAFGAVDETLLLTPGEKVIFNKLAALEKKVDALVEELHPPSSFDKKKLIPKGL